MFVSKRLFSVVILCVVHETLSKPTESALTQGRSVGSTLWGWITYPFTGWWSSDDTEPKPINDQLVASTTYGPSDNIELGKHNVTVWCNEQTCTTMKCNKNGCKNNTCNMYDTYLDGECREYNTIVDPDKPITTPELTTVTNTPPNHKPIVITTQVNDDTTKSPESAPVFIATVTTTPNIDVKDEHKYAVQSVPVTKVPVEKVEITSGSNNKITDIPTFVGISVRETATATDSEGQGVKTNQ